jgi:MFS family permease
MSVSILKLAHIPDDKVAWFYFAGSLCCLPGTLMAAYTTSKAGRKTTLPVAYFLATLTAMLMYPAASYASITGESTWVWVTYCLYQFAYTFAWNTSYPMYAELFPTQYRSTGIGLAVCVGRVGGFVAPIVLTATFDSNGGENALGALLLVACFFLSTCLASIPWAIYGIEAEGKSLEDCVELKHTKMTESLPDML